MKKYILSLMAALVVFSVLAGCTGKPEPTPTPDNQPGSVEFDDSDLSGLIDDDFQTDGDFGDIDVSFKDPNILEGYYILEKPMSELGKELGIKTDSVRMTLARARRKAYELLEKELEESR